jgi:plasmid segregation protein ParM
VGEQLIIAVDNEVKVCGPNGLMKFGSAIGAYRTRNINEQHGEDDMVWEYDGEMGTAGTLAIIENEFGSGMMLGGSKNHFWAKMRILLALHKYTDGKEIYLAVANPISAHSVEDTQDIQADLTKEHAITVNGILKTFEIKKVVVMAEGSIAYFSQPVQEKVRIIDIGSGPVNCATILNKKVVDKDSSTLEYGMKTSKDGEADPATIANAIIMDTSKKWKRMDPIYVVGGAAGLIVHHLQKHYVNAQLMKPQIRIEKGLQIATPIYANVIGMYNLLSQALQKVKQ